MKTRLLTFAFITGLLAFAGTGCKPPPQIKSVAGDGIPKLDTNTINAIWLTGGDEKGVIATRLKDAPLGIIEVATLEISSNEIGLQKFEAIMRDSPAGMLFSAKFPGKDEKQDGYWFGRAVITGDHLVLFFADENRLKELVERGLLKGAFAKNEKGDDTSQFVLESLGKEDFDRLLTNGVSPELLFSHDPAVVCLRLGTAK